MNKQEILALSNDQLNDKVNELRCVDTSAVTSTFGLYAEDIEAAFDLFESVYGRGGKIKSGAWVLGTVHNGRDCAQACLLWKGQGFMKFRALKVEATCPRGEMARAITLCWVCAMLGVHDE